MKSNKHCIFQWATGGIFFVAFFLYFFFYARYQIIYYEQQQLFQFHSSYLNRLLIQLGGGAAYLSSFLIQFFYFPALGASILTLLLFAVYGTIVSIFRSWERHSLFFILPLIPVLGLWMMLCNYEFEITCIVALLLVSICIAIYVRIKSPGKRYLSGIIGFMLLYFVVGGASLVAAWSFLIYELMYTSGKRKYWIGLTYVLLTCLQPLLTWRFIYAVPLKDLYFPSFIFDGEKNVLWIACCIWLFVPTILLIKGGLPERTLKSAKQNTKSWVVPVCGTILFVCIGYWGISKSIDRRINLMMQMDYEVQCGNWDRVLGISQQYPTTNRLVTYYTNIALYKTGQLPYHFFDYHQNGPGSLFLEWHRDYFTMVAGSEVFYQLGFTNEANHWTFEALTASKNGANPRLLKRLVQNAIINEEYPIAAKYLRILHSSLFYRQWANEYLTLLDEPEQIGRLPWVSEKRSQFVQNDFLSGQKAPANLPLFFEEHPENKMAFEYMMMYLLLTKNLESFLPFINQLPEYDYTTIPTLFEEAILAYLNKQEADRETYRKYPIHRETYNRFNQYTKHFEEYSSNPQTLKQNMSKLYGNTYWFYFHLYTPPAKPVD